MEPNLLRRVLHLRCPPRRQHRRRFCTWEEKRGKARAGTLCPLPCSVRVVCACSVCVCVGVCVRLCVCRIGISEECISFYQSVKQLSVEDHGAGAVKLVKLSVE